MSAEKLIEDAQTPERGRSSKATPVSPWGRTAPWPDWPLTRSEKKDIVVRVTTCELQSCQREMERLQDDISSHHGSSVASGGGSRHTSVGGSRPTSIGGETSMDGPLSANSSSILDGIDEGSSRSLRKSASAPKTLHDSMFPRQRLSDDLGPMPSPLTDRGSEFGDEGSVTMAESMAELQRHQLRVEQQMMQQMQQMQQMQHLQQMQMMQMMQKEAMSPEISLHGDETSDDGSDIRQQRRTLRRMPASRGHDPGSHSCPARPSHNKATPSSALKGGKHRRSRGGEEGETPQRVQFSMLMSSSDEEPVKHRTVSPAARGRRRRVSRGPDGRPYLVCEGDDEAAASSSNGGKSGPSLKQAGGGVVGSVVGLAGGVVGGAVAALPAALFTFGLSIPVGAAFGGGIGATAGGVVGYKMGSNSDKDPGAKQKEANVKRNGCKEEESTDSEAE